MTDPASLAAILLTFLLAGTVKGIVGLGLPTVSLGLLVTFFDLPAAMALMLVPSVATNLWQAFAGGHAAAVAKRLWPFLLPAAATVPIGALALTRVDLAYLSALLGLLMALYGGIGLSGLRLSVPRASEAWAGPLTGAINGILTGLTGSFAVPGVMYLQAIGLPRDQLIQAMGMLFSVSTLALALSLGGSRLLSAELGLISLAGLVPALAGMAIGQRIRRRLDERTFRLLLFGALIILGVTILVRSIASAT